MGLKTLRSEIAKLRRDQPRNPTSMAVCDGAEEALNEMAVLRGATAPKPTTGNECPTCEARRVAKAETMRRYRKKAKR